MPVLNSDEVNEQSAKINSDQVVFPVCINILATLLCSKYIFENWIPLENETNRQIIITESSSCGLIQNEITNESNLKNQIC